MVAGNILLQLRRAIAAGEENPRVSTLPGSSAGAAGEQAAAAVRVPCAAICFFALTQGARHGTAPAWFPSLTATAPMQPELIRGTGR